MAPPRLHVIAATPGAESICQIVDRLAGPITLCTFSPARLSAARRAIGESDRVEFVEFGVLVGDYLAMAGGSLGGLPGRGHLGAAVEIACQAIEGGPFVGSAPTRGFQECVTAALDRLRGHGFEAEQLDEAAASAEIEGNSALAAWLRSLAFIQRESAATLETLGKRFNSERIRQCLETEAVLSTQSRLVIWAGCHDDPVDVDWIPWAVRSGVDVTVVVDGHPSNPDMFPGAQAVVRRLGVEPGVVQRTNALTGALFAKESGPEQSSSLDVHVILMPDRLGECEWTLRAALEEIEGGTDPDRIVIVARNLEIYGPLLEAAAIRHRVPIRVRRTVGLLAIGATRFIVELLHAVAHRDPNVLHSLTKSSYFGLDELQRHEIEEAFRAARENRADPWMSLREWALDQQERFPWLLQLVEWRAKCLAEPGNLASWSDRLQDLGELPWLGHVYDAQGDVAERDRLAMNALRRCIAEVAAVERVRGNRPLSLAGFAALVRARCERERLTVSLGEHGVHIANSAEEIGLADSVYVIGMLEGQFPRRRQEDPILYDDHLAWLSARVGTPIPDSHRRAIEERDEFYRVCAAAGTRLVLSYPQADDDRDNVEAFYLAEVSRIMGVQTESRSRKQWTADPPLSEADIKLKEALEDPTVEFAPTALVSEDVKASIRRRTGERYRLRDLQRVLACPFRYVFGSRLRLHANRPESRWNRVLALPSEVELASQPNPESARSALTNRLDALVDSLYGDASHEDLALMRMGGRRLIDEWVHREFEARSHWAHSSTVANPRFGDELRGKFTPEGRESLELEGGFPALSEIGGHNVLHVYRGRLKLEDVRNRTFSERMGESDRFELGMALFSVRKGSEGIGLEIDSTDGERRLLLHPRPARPPSGAEPEFRVSAIDKEDAAEWKTFLSQQCVIALDRLSKPEINAAPGEECSSCDLGELCRRAKDFSEVADPFEIGVGDDDAE